ncbi:TMP-TENI-domain-containing protein [Anaeromyces robustus]|uniref:TMP-TENI-domain-containing protein n=1 Tax=Anaeromyces robustus TaxID=1754192 RepID=A0A1Y1X6Z8_9FUNG|nr:TMP-TENI-domain-containing protein [Anaeromyces robustus]|eukprot:ORX81547.1 TMP-TENI-domain-containing protein [Anaeromyces robustus]
MVKNIDISLYLVTDSSLVPEGKTLPQVVEEAIEGGVTFVQLREKECETREFIKKALEIKKICKEHNIPFVINDRIDIALAVDADGVHLGQKDMTIEMAKEILGPNKIIGITCETNEQAIKAAKAGADYIGSLAIFPTKTKKFSDDFTGLGKDGLVSLLDSIAEYDTKVVAIGGLKPNNLEEVVQYCNKNISKGKNIDGVACTSGIIASPDAKKTSSEIASIVAKIEKVNTKTLNAATPDYEIVKKIGEALYRIKENSPLIHTITNFVVMNDAANITIEIGGSPCMAHGLGEVEEFARIAGCVVINSGTLSSEWNDSFYLAGKAAEKAGTPIVFDPVAAGATDFRLKTCKSLLSSFKVTVLKGNAGEISAIAGFGGAASKGVDSTGSVDKPFELVSKLAQNLNTCVCMSGAVDYISDGKRSISLHNGVEMLEKITGSGCTLSNLIGCFAAIEKDPLIAAAGGVLSMCIAGELAMKQTSVRGPRTFFAALHDEIYLLTAEKFQRFAKIHVESWE